MPESLNEPESLRAGTSETARPLWVKWMVVTGVVLIVIVVVMLLSGHSPGRHMGAGPGPAGATVQAIGDAAGRGLLPTALT